MQLFGRHFDTAGPVRIEVDDGRIARIAPLDVTEPSLAHWPWIAPGLFDIQANGYGGQEFSASDLTPEKVDQIARAYLSFGVTRFCPTLTTASSEVLDHALRAIDVACETSADLARWIAGVHLEGPYLTREDGPRGAHPLEHCRVPDWDEFQRFQEAAGGRIVLHTLSPEFDEAPAFIQKVARQGTIVAIGHTAADSDHIRRAVDAGARLSTHLGNGAHLMLPRHPNYLWDQLAEDRLEASLIVDGHHLPPEVVKTFVRAKTPRRSILVSDMSGLGGLPPGRYQTNLCDLEILPDGRLVVAGQHKLLAGASRPLGAGVANVMHFADVDLGTAARMASEHPAKLLGLEPDALAPGKPANLIAFYVTEPVGPSRTPKISGLPEFKPQATVSNGQLVWGTLWDPELDSPG